MRPRLAVPRRTYQLGTAAYAAVLSEPKPPLKTENLRRRAVSLIRAGTDDWFSSPMQSLRGGAPCLPQGRSAPTVDAFGAENGLQLLASYEDVKAIVAESKTFRARNLDATLEAVRSAEERLFDPEGALAPQLVANQALDFHKQDGVTEIEEAIRVRPVERSLNDQLLEDERRGLLTIDRSPVLVFCVQNFSNFLDLSRKVLRNVECGVPVLIASRATVGQHCFRWAQLLSDELDDDSKKLVNFLCCDLSVQRRVLAEDCDDMAAYLTGSRRAAIAVKELVRRTFSSCGGPNTMVLCSDAALDVGAFAAAARDSALIEHAGQCTALRHVVAPGPASEVERRLLSSTPNIEPVVRSSAADALENKCFAALLPEAPDLGDVAEDLRRQGYSVAGDGDDVALPSVVRDDTRARVAWRVTPGTPAPDWTLDEHWRRVVLDVSAPPSRAALLDEEDRLAAWLLEQQPISVAVNKLAIGDEEALRFARRLWEKSACSVFTVGDAARPAITVQARPQDGELFGEVPPRSFLDKFTVAPVIVPSSTPAAGSASYDPSYLQALASDDETDRLPPGVAAIVRSCESPEARGYCIALWRYLASAAQGPQIRDDSREDEEEEEEGRACLFGLQRPPLGSRGATWLRVSHLDDFDAAAPALVAFIATNAASQLRASVHPQNSACLERVAAALGPGFVADAFARKLSDAEFEADVRHSNPWNVVRAADYDSGAKATTPAGQAYGLAATFVARLFPVGHVKSTRAHDPAFLHAFADSPKWLRCCG